MALRHLTEADCGQSNALVQLTTHITRDRGFVESRFAQDVFPGSSDQLVEQFLQETQCLPQSFRMDDLMREMHEIESQRSLLPPVPAGPVKDHLIANGEPWAAEFVQQSHMQQQEEPVNHEAVWAEISAREKMHQPESRWHEDYHREVEVLPGEIACSHRAHELLRLAEDDRLEYSKFLRFMKQEDQAEAVGDVTDEQQHNWSEEYAQEQAEPITAIDENAASANFWSKLQEEWKKLAEQDEDHPWISDYNEFYDPYKEYEFTEENSMFDVRDPLQRGKELLKQGDLPSAVLCFEAAVKNDPNLVEGWLLLGTTQAENEQDPKAISALKRCVQLDPENLTALMSLAVSYTNENYHHQACQCLVNWLRHHPEYNKILPADFSLSVTGQVTSLIRPEQHKAVQNLFIAAALERPVNPDYEIQCGLGVLFNMSAEYDKAADCFRTALNVKPNDAKLWNRLGATLANGSKPEEAVDAYHQALQMEPGFIRARYNVGITCINLGAYKEAAEHFLMALNQQARAHSEDGNVAQMSETIWATLRMCISLMNADDKLKEAVDNRNLQVLNENFQIHDD